MSKKIELKFEENQFHLMVDPNEDGEAVVKLNLNLNEALQEVLSRGEAIEGKKVVDFKFDMKGIRIKFDTDKDGEDLGEIFIDFMESIDEVQSLFKKDEVPA